MSSQKITLTLPADLLDRINEAAKASYCSRSDYLRESAVLRLNSQQITPKPTKPKTQRPMTQQEEEAFLKDLVEQYS